MLYNKDEIKSKITLDIVFDIVRDLGGDPRRMNQGFVAGTICHNHPGEGSHKLYYYENSHLFRCYTECDSSFDIFELVIKAHNLKYPNTNMSLYAAIAWVAKRCGFNGVQSDDDFDILPDWNILEKYNKIKEEPEQFNSVSQIYDKRVLTNLPKPHITDWLNEGITQTVLDRNQICYYPVDEQIAIPHFDINNNFIGLRGRALGKEQAELFGKYRPIRIGQTLYNHPLGWHLYNLNNSKENIKRYKKVIVFEGEKSTLLYQSYFGLYNDISVACCGSSISMRQIGLLLALHPNECIIAFDRQFQTKGDNEYKQWIKHLKAIYAAYNRFVPITFIFDKDNKLGYKESPIDRGPEIFIELYNERVRL